MTTDGGPDENGKLPAMEEPVASLETAEMGATEETVKGQNSL